jgi:hypothetical protein
MRVINQPGCIRIAIGIMKVWCLSKTLIKTETFVLKYISSKESHVT